MSKHFVKRVVLIIVSPWLFLLFFPISVGWWIGSDIITYRGAVKAVWKDYWS